MLRQNALEPFRDTERYRQLALDLQRYDIAADAAHYSFLGKLAADQRPLKEIMLGLDIGVAFQQGLRGIRVGTTSALTSALARVVDHTLSALGKNVDSFGIYPNAAIAHRAQAMSDGLILRGSASVGLERSAAREAADRLLSNRLHLGRLVQRGIEKLADVQYQQLDRFRLQVYEGRLYQSKLLGQDITDPVVRREIADFANMAGSTARTATQPGRAMAEQALQLSAPLTRAQFAEIAQPFKSVTSATQALNTLNQVASMAITFGLAYAVQQQFGPDMTPEQFLAKAIDPRSTSFGRLVLGKGKSSKVFDFLPQYSLERAILKSINAAQEGDLKRIGDAWVRFGTGRLNVGPSGVMSLAGVGYGPGGKYYYGDMPLKTRAIEAAPTPLTIEGAVVEGESDIASIVLQGLGGNTWSESDFQRRSRETPQLQSAIDLYWEAYDEAFKVVKQAGLQGPYAPLLRESGSYDELRSQLDQIADEVNRINPKMDKDRIVQGLLEELGITRTAQEIRKLAVRRDAGLIEYLEGRGTEVPKYMWEALPEGSGVK